MVYGPSARAKPQAHGRDPSGVGSFQIDPSTAPGPARPPAATSEPEVLLRRPECPSGVPCYANQKGPSPQAPDPTAWLLGAHVCRDPFQAPQGYPWTQ
jgi:hypothetical protein